MCFTLCFLADQLILERPTPQLIFFVDEYHIYGKPPPSFRLANLDETQRARQHTFNLRVTKKAWTCNHFQEFYEDDKAETQAVILTHLRER